MFRGLYEPVYVLLDGSPLLLNLFGWVVSFTGWYFTLSLLLLYTDVTGKPAWMLKYKVQQGQNQPVDSGKLWKAVKVVCFNMIVINLTLFYPMHLFHNYVGMPLAVDELPSVGRLLLDILGFAIVQEFIFYYSHRLFHHPLIYKHVHKQHHEWTAPIGLIATYATPLEYTTGNGMSVFLGPVLLRSHIFTVWVWYVLAVSVTIIHHSGYHLPFLPSPEFHDYHHLKFRGNYGTLGFLDRLHGTDVEFKKTVNWRRHQTLLGFTPIWTQIPERKSTSASVANGEKHSNGHVTNGKMKKAY